MDIALGELGLRRSEYWGIIGFIITLYATE